MAKIQDISIQNIHHLIKFDNSSVALAEIVTNKIDNYYETASKAITIKFKSIVHYLTLTIVIFQRFFLRSITCYVRSDSMMIKMTDGDSFETNCSLIQELTFNKLEEELKRIDLEFTEVQMKNLGILFPDDIYTNMVLLVSDQYRHSIKFAIFQGTDKVIFKDRKEFTGSLFNQLTDEYKTIDFYNGTKATFHDLLRTDERDYPEDAVREALLNSIVHREYAFSGSIFINLFSDRLEIISLGGLVYGLSLEAGMLGTSQPRNEKLASLFYRMKLIEAYGKGISKIISCYKGLSVQPKFENKKEITRNDIEEALGIGTTHAYA